MAGENLPLIGMLLGHLRRRTTAGYAHLQVFRENARWPSGVTAASEAHLT